MSHSLTLLAWTLVLGLVHLGAAALAKRFQEPRGWGAGSRDQQLPPYSGLAGRLTRAQGNFMETMPFFAAAVLICALTQRSGVLVDRGASLYFWGRVVYLPLYATGVRYLRTGVWIVALIGLIMVLSACVTP